MFDRPASPPARRADASVATLGAPGPALSPRTGPAPFDLAMAGAATRRQGGA
jgi:hypothetical protein